MTSQGTPSTLTVADAQSVNTNAAAVGIATDVNGAGNATFAGTSTVRGTVGSGALRLNVITAGAAAKTVTFSNNVFATQTNLSNSGTIVFNGDYTGNLNYNNGATGTVVLGTGRTLTGTVTNAASDQGVLTLGSGSSVTGAVGSVGVGLNRINVTSGNASIGGNTAATNFSVGANTLAVTGTLGLNASSVLSTTVMSSSTFGKLTSTGVATVPTGATVDVHVAGFMTSGTGLKVIDGAAGASGNTINVTDDSIRYTFTAAQTLGDVTITPTQLPLTTFTTSQNTTAVGIAFDASAASATGDMLVVQNEMSLLGSAVEVDNALSQMDPVNNGGMTQSTFEASRRSLDALVSHLDEVGGEARGVSTGDPADYSGMWLKAFGDYAVQNSHRGVNGYKAGMGGGLLGCDSLLNDRLRLGFGGGAIFTHVENMTSDSGNTDVDGYVGLVYASYDLSPFFIDSALSYTWNNYDARRDIEFGGIHRNATSNYTGQLVSAMLSGRRVFQFNDLSVVPLASIQYSHLAVDSYVEAGAGALDLAVSGQDYDLLESAVGVQFAYQMRFDGGSYTPEVHFRWLHDFAGDEQQTVASFDGASTTFVTHGLEAVPNSFNVGGSLKFATMGNTTVTGYYDYGWKDDYSTNYGSVTVRTAY